MGAQLDLGKTRLFDENSLNVSNIKLFPGSSRDATPEQMAEQVNKAVSQIEANQFEYIQDSHAE